MTKRAPKSTVFGFQAAISVSDPAEDPGYEKPATYEETNHGEAK